MPKIWTPKNSKQYAEWFEKNYENTTKEQVFKLGLDLITYLESNRNNPTH